MTEPPADRCPDCWRDLPQPGTGIAITRVVCGCGAVLYPSPEHPPAGPVDGRCWHFTGPAWLPVYEADAFGGTDAWA